MRIRLKWHRKDWVVLSKENKTKLKSAKVKWIQVMCALYTGEGKTREGERVLWLQRGHYWLFLCSVRLVDASVGVSPRAALERMSTHLAWSSASWALRSKVCWVWLSRSVCLTSDFSPAGGGITLTSNPGRGTARAPLESYRNEQNKPVWINQVVFQIVKTNYKYGEWQFVSSVAGEHIAPGKYSKPCPPLSLPPLSFCIIRKCSCYSH